MSTSGSFNPPADAPCPYPTYMTHAEAVALRDAGQLDPRCQIVITDGPVIGTVGNTSPTSIELNPAGPGDIGRDARVHTNFDNVAFSGLYNIDDGPNGSINELVDHWNNRISDEDPGAPTVHTQFPYHLSSANLRDNDVNDCTLTGWDTAVSAGALITDNELLNAGIHLTGVGAFSQMVRNRVQGPQITISSPRIFFNNNDIRNSPVTLNGTAAGTQSFQTNTILSGNVEVTAATTAVVNIDRNVIGGTGTIGFRILVDGATVGTNINGNRMFNQGVSSTAELWIKGAAGASITSNELTAPVLNLNGAGGNIIIDGSRLAATTVTKDPACAVGTTIRTSELGTATITYGAANAGTSNLIQRSRIKQGPITLNGPLAGGRNDFDLVDADSFSVTVAATATAGVNLQGGYYSGGTITQNRTAGTGSTTFFDCDMRGFTTVTDNGTTDPGQSPSFNRCRFTDTVVTIGNLAAKSPGGSIAQQLDCIGSTLTITGLGGAGVIDAGRMTKSTLINAGFQIGTFEFLAANKTLTADNLNVMADPSFDNVL